MLHHVSFAVRDPSRDREPLRRTIARAGRGRARAALPGRLVVRPEGEDVGTLIELTPWGSILASTV